MLSENLKDAGEIVENILSQPLSVSGLTDSCSLVEASKKYLNDPSSPELKKMLETFLQHPQALEVMLQEFKLLAQDLAS
jgi:hypothetical protein